MNRRRYLTSIGASAAALAGCTAVGESGDNSRPGYLGKHEVIYEHDDLELRLLRETVRFGDTVEFEVTNTSLSKIILGCNNPWALQRRSDGDWQHVTWTGDRYYQMCALELSPADSRVENITLSESELERYPDEHSTKLRPGRYRFLLLGPSPFLAIDFDVLRR